jgi:hypothetical protein
MSSLWTPSGEHPIDRDRATPAQPSPAPPTGGESRGRGGPSAGAPPGTTGGAAATTGEGPTTEEARQQAAELRRQLAEAPPEVVVANHCFGLFELAAVYLSQPEPLLDQARLAIDALGAVVESLAGRLGEAEPSLCDALAQIRMAYVQLGAAHEQAPTGADGAGT